MQENLAEKRLDAEEMAKRLALLEAVLDAIVEGVIVTDASGKILYFNEAQEKIEGLKKDEVIGRYLHEVYQVSPKNSDHAVAIKKEKPSKDKFKTFFTTEGKEINLAASTYPVKHEGRTVGAFSVCRDFTRVKDLIKKNMSLQRQMHLKWDDRHLKNGTRYTLDDFIYTSKTIDRLINQARKAALTDCPVLVYGETGTGKEVLAQGFIMPVAGLMSLSLGSTVRQYRRHFWKAPFLVQ